MADINRVVLVGRLTRDAELKYIPSGTAVSKFSIAINRRKKSGDEWTEEVNFFDIVLWGRQGEVLNQYLVKGKQVGIEGELHQNRWEQDGQSRSKVEIVASNIQLLGGSGGGHSANRNDYTAPQQQSAYQPRRPAPQQQDYSHGFDNADLDDVPF